MTYFDAILLGIIQGITEFIPVSSDGHIALAENFGLVGNVPFFFTVSVHAGTLLATFVFFRKIIWDIVTRLIQRERGAIVLSISLVIGTIPAGIAGVLLNKFIDGISSSLFITGFGFFLSSGWLFMIDRLTQSAKSLKDISVKDALFVGVLQVTALLPGASRSGATLFAGRYRKLKPEDAFVFSFLLSIPAILGALVLQIFDAQITQVPQSIIGAAVAAIVGYTALQTLKKLVVQNRLYWLALYCAGVGFLSLVVWLL